jgi:hypothetical protein
MLFRFAVDAFHVFRQSDPDEIRRICRDLHRIWRNKSEDGFGRAVSRERATWEELDILLFDANMNRLSPCRID